MKTALLKLLTLAMLSCCVSAYADSYLSIDAKGAGLCLSVDALDNPKCQNNSLTLDGTSDHTVYILPESQIAANASMSDKAEYFMFTPINLLVGGFGFLLACAFFAYAIFTIVTNMRGGRKFK
jgi:hypothetical protein